MKTFFRSFALMIVLLASGVVATAQVTTASIGGLVTSTEGEALPGATIKATHTPTGTVYFVSTHTNGRYNIAGMRIGGPYTLEISFVGYKTETVNNISLALAEEAVYNVKMSEEAMALDEVVIVGERNPIIGPNRTGSQEIFTREKMDRLPTIDRSLADFTKLTPTASNGNFAGTSYRYNNTTVDGASFNNSFGLSSALGASGIEPISLEAIEQIQVMIAPFDVRNGAFTGAGINSVTKSGTNEWKGTAYWYMKSPDLEGTRQKDVKEAKNDFTENHYGLSVGGPLIKNKLFFFLNAELDRIATPVNWRPRPNASTPTAGTNYSIADEETLSKLAQFLINNFDYNPGSYNVSSVPTEADRITARLDWNIDTKNTLSFKYFYLRSFSTSRPSTSGAMPNGRGANKFAIPFSSSYYRGNNNFHIFMADLNTTINERMSNTLKVGYSMLRDYRSMDGGFFPEVNIGDGSSTGGKSNAFTTFGTEANSYNNLLHSDIFQIQDNFTWIVGDHQLTFGTQSDYRTFKNGFANSFAGQYKYDSIEQFYADANAHLAWVAAGSDPSKRPTSNASYYKQVYAVDGGFPYAYTSVLTLGFYAQDRWTITPKFNLTFGVRADIPIFTSSIEKNTIFDGVTFAGDRKIDTSKLPSTKVLISPRVGFNWDVLGDRTLQVRGGTGMFTGTPPYVWISNQAGNNGLLFGQTSTKYAFSGNTNIPADGGAAKASIAITDPDLKYPQVWKTNVAVDYKWGNGWIATVEFLYNKDVNGLYHIDINHPNYDRSLVKELNGADQRPYFLKNKLRDCAYDVIMMTNTNKGYSLYTTLQLQKEFKEGALKGLYVNGSYSFGVAKSVSDGSSSVASSAYKYRAAVRPDDDELGYSSGSFPDRFLLQVSYRKEYAKHFASSIGIIYDRYVPFRYSYTYNGDVNNDSYSYNDLIYVPRNMEEIRIVQKAGDTRSELAVWNDINGFIKQDPYLSKHRGEYVERNGATAPYVNQVDLNFTQDFFVTTRGGKRNTIRLSADITNFLNLLNKDWGVQQTTVLGNQQYQFLEMTEKPSAANNWTPGFTMQDNLTKTFEDYVGSASRWSMQIGVKYLFN